ncbi:alpha-2-macroglobulin family protein [uncultured Tateyamaria sp.]|uniref:alpha-2-macroglobulin family protein n=1 Tax=Tateyamaria sp. 1078 TaxID=3417464 RepID=UPI002613E92C|nr:alpha-2-macroglobulin family protein [uncultured Tateyamaria sp.]
MRLIAYFATVLTLATGVAAQNAVPDRRYVFSRDVDFYGADRANLFDTTQEACQRACSADDQCVAFTFNTRSNACFPKSAVNAREPYVGAISATRVETPARIVQGAAARAAALAPGDRDLNAARVMAQSMGARYPVGSATVDDLIAAADAAWQRGDRAAALRWVGGAVALTDAPDLWTRYADHARRLGDTVTSAQRRRARNEAVPAALNGYLRAQSEGGQATALIELALAYEATRRGRDMIAPLRLAQAIQPRDSTSDMLDKAIGKYGFRTTDHTVDNDAANPRICATFSEPLIKAGFDYDPYVTAGEADLVAQADGVQLCLDGARHGTRYQITLRQGLPAQSGEVLARDVQLSIYVRDRAPAVRFPGRAYVLARGGDVALPVETVNLDEVELVLSRVSDRNLVRALREDVFGRPLSQWQEREFKASMGEEVWRGTGAVLGDLNVETRTRLPLSEALGGQPAGIYVLSARVPGSDPYSQASATQWFVLSDLGITTWQGNDGMTAAVRALGDASAVAGADVTLVSRANAVLATTRTDADGYVTFPAGVTRGRGAAAPAMVQVRAGEDFVFLPLTGPAFDLSDRGVEGRPPAPPIDLFLTTDRGAYRPGGTVHVTTLARDAQTMALTGLPVTAILFRPDGVEYSRVLSDADMAGGHVFSLPLGHAVPRGTWRVEVKSDLNAPALASQTLLVEDFVPERIDVSLDLPGGPLTLGVASPIRAEARYLFGAPGADLAVEGDLRLTRRDTLADKPGYRFGRHDAAFSARQSALPSLRTDANGLAQVPLNWPEIEAEGVLLQAAVTLRVSDGAGRPVERTVTRPVAPAGPVIGIRPAFDDVLPEGAEAQFDLIAAGAAQPMPATWTVNRVETRYQWYQLYGNWNWEPVTTRTRVAQGDVTLSDQPVQVSVPTDWGDYEFVVARADGLYTASSFGFSAGWYGASDSSDTPDRALVALNAAAYAPGDIATLRIDAPFDGTALVSVLASDVIERRTVPVVAGENTVMLDVTPDWGTGAYVAASILRGTAQDAFGPSRALGIAHAAIDPGSKALAVTLDAPTTTDGQAGNTEVTVRVDGLGSVQGYVTLAAVDVGILNLTGFEAPDPQGHYFGQRRLGVDLRDLYGRLIDSSSGALGTIRSGGDAAAGMARQGPPPTEAVMAAFSGPVRLGPDGTATIPIPRPAFNGTIRLMAVAWSAQGVGQAQTEVVARDPVVISAALPRFMAPGDQSRVQLEFVHAAGQAGQMDLSVTASGISVGQAPAQIDIAQSGTLRVALPIRANAVGDHSITAVLTTPDGTTLRKALTLGVRSNDPTIAITRRLTLAAGAALTLDDNLFADLRPDGAEVTVAAGPLSRFDMPGLLRQLDRYPYGCTEQVTSAALPLLYASDLATGAGLDDIDMRINDAIARVLTRQASSGAFGMWRAQAGEFWLDAYVTDFLSQARMAGYAVPDHAMTLALDNLRNRVNYAPDFDSGGQDLAYALLVLAREGAARIGDLRYYVDTKSTAFATPLARAQMGAALAQYGEQARADKMFGLAQDMALSPSPDGPRWRADFGTPVRDAAGVLHLAAQAGSNRVDRTALASVITGQNRSYSTQEAAQIVMAAQALRAPGGPALFAVNGTQVVGPVVRSHSARGTASLIENISGTAQDLTLTTYGVPIVAPQAGGYGYAITRRSFTMDGAPVDGPWQVGERRVIVLDVTPFEEVGARLMVDDPLPAGIEIDNPNLLRSGDIRALDWLKPATTEHAEFRTDRFLAAVNHRGSETFQLAYVARAVSPGDFHHPAARVEDMYRPEYRAITGTSRTLVRE